MRWFLILCLAMAAAAAAARLFDGAPGTALAGGERAGGGDAPCASLNGDANADGGVDISDAVTILSHLFLGDPAQFVPLCRPPDLTARVQELEAEVAALKGSLDASTAEISRLGNQLSECLASQNPSPLLEAGQSRCYDLDGQETACSGGACPGQDGAFAMGCPMEGRFTDNRDGTVTDGCTGLMWQMETGNDRDSLSWCEALAYCENLSLAGHDDWRLPNVRELETIVDYGRFNSSIDPKFGALSTWYWSSTSYAGHPGFAWLVLFHDGNVSLDAKDILNSVRAVRGGS